VTSANAVVVGDRLIRYGSVVWLLQTASY